MDWILILKYVVSGVVGFIVAWFIMGDKFDPEKVKKALEFLDDVVDVAVKTVEQYSKNVKEIEVNGQKVPFKGRAKLEEALKIVGFALGKKGIARLKKVMDNVEGFIVAKIEQKVHELNQGNKKGQGK